MLLFFNCEFVCYVFAGKCSLLVHLYEILVYIQVGVSKADSFLQLSILTFMDQDALQTSIQYLQERRQHLLRQVAELDVEIGIEFAKYTRILNDDAPVYRLPNDLLTHIFLLCQHHSRKGSIPPFQVIASHVSHRWRTIVITTPLLWNTIAFRIPYLTIERVLSQLEAHLERSHRCFLDITLRFVVVSPSDLTRFLSLLAPHASRWRRLSLSTNLNQVQPFEELLSTARTPILEHLSLTVGNYRDETDSGSPRQLYPTMQSTILAPDIPLSFVRLAGHALGHLHPPLSFVTTLHIDGWTRHYTIYAQLKSVFESAPCLVNLSLNQVYMHHSRDPSTLHQPVTLAHLRQLRLRGPCSTPTRFFALIDAPNLEAFSLHLIDDIDLGGPLPSLRRIEIEQCALDETVLAALMQATPGIVEASIDDCVPDILTLLLPSNERRLWPRMHTLALRDLPPADVSFLCNLVYTHKEMRRIDAEGAEEEIVALKKLCLDRRSRTVLRARQRLDWLEQYLTVQHCEAPDPWPLGLGYEDPHDLFV